MISLVLLISLGEVFLVSVISVVHSEQCTCILSINVPVVYVVRYVMILMRGNQFRGPLEGGGP